MKKTIFLLNLVVIITISCNRQTNPGVNNISLPGNYNYGIPGRSRDEIIDLIEGQTYYLDANSGNDSSEICSSSSPCKTLSRVQKLVKPGDGVFLRNGSYGSFEEIGVNSRSKWTVYINESGHTPEFSRIYIHNYKTTNSNLIFYGIKVQVDPVDPASSGKTGADDPYYPQSTMDTYAKTVNPLDIQFSNNIEIYNCSFSGTHKNLTPIGFSGYNINHFLLEGCEISKVRQAVSYWGKSSEGNTSEITLRGNHFHGITRSCITEGSYGMTKRVIIGNYAHDSNCNYGTEAEGGDPWSPRAGDLYHGSAIGIRNGDIVIKNNIWHNGWKTAGIEFIVDGLYDGTTVFSDILIENNLLYDIGVTMTVIVDKLGSNVLLRNNTIAGWERTDTTNGSRKYSTVLWLRDVATGNGSGLALYNNIFIGPVILGKNWQGNVIEDNNIFWAYFVDDSGNILLKNGEKGNKSRIITCDSTSSDYFTNKFFQDTGMRFDRSHGQTLNFRLETQSNGVNLGNPDNQPNDSLGSISEGFILSDGEKRNSEHHSAGAYE